MKRIFFFLRGAHDLIGSETVSPSYWRQFHGRERETSHRGVLPKPELANGCAVVLCPGGAMRWLSWESDVIKMAAFLNKQVIAAIGLRYHLNKGGGQLPQGAKMPLMVDVAHPEAL